MKRLFTAAAAIAIFAGTAGAALAQPRHDDHHHGNGPAMHGPSMHSQRHSNWHKGGRIDRNDWNRGSRVDYRSRHLQRPPRGYEWRQVDGNYVLAAAATGLIASILLANQ